MFRLMLLLHWITYLGQNRPEIRIPFPRIQTHFRRLILWYRIKEIMHCVYFCQKAAVHGVYERERERKPNREKEGESNICIPDCFYCLTFDALHDYVFALSSSYCVCGCVIYHYHDTETQYIPNVTTVHDTSIIIQMPFVACCEVLTPILCWFFISLEMARKS